MSLPVFILHALLCTGFGLFLSDRLGLKTRNPAFAFLLGSSFETLLLAALLFGGLSFGFGLAVTIAGMTLGTLLAFIRHKSSYSLVRNISLPTTLLMLWFLFLFGMLLSDAISEPLLYPDALGYWSGRGRLIFEGLYFDFNPESRFFLGTFPHPDYPLMIPLWRAAVAGLSGEWSFWSERADGLLYALCILYFVYGGLRPIHPGLARTGCLALSLYPLFQVHVFSGNADLAIAAFSTGAACCLIRRQGFPALLLAACAAWSKKDGLFLVFCPVLICVLYLDGRRLFRLRLFAAVPPLLWFLFLLFSGRPLLLPSQSFEFHPDALVELFKLSFFGGEAEHLLWVPCFVFVLRAKRFFISKKGRLALLALTSTFCVLVAVFCFTSAYQFLQNETTVHRSLLQLFPAWMLWVFSAAFDNRHSSPEDKVSPLQENDESMLLVKE